MKILNCDAVQEAEKNTVFAARLTQHGHEIHSMDDLMRLYNKEYTEKTLKSIISLPHPTVQKFEVITVAIVGASRRFLSQITRHQNEVKFMSASLQYSNYAGKADFVIPYEILTAPEDVQESYLEICQDDMAYYELLTDYGVDHDTAGYVTPQALRNILIISATPYQWKHMIGQRVCRRNTDEMQIVMLKVWKELYQLSPVMFSVDQAGTFCQRDRCMEGKMSCGDSCMAFLTPDLILDMYYPALKEAEHEDKAD